LDEAIPEPEALLPGFEALPDDLDEQCDSGHCFL
jgi:hypothetical protein